MLLTSGRRAAWPLYQDLAAFACRYPVLPGGQVAEALSEAMEAAAALGPTGGPRAVCKDSRAVL